MKISTRLKQVLFSLTLLVGISLIPAAAQASFDPNNIIDDSVFTNANTMSVTDIQNFLNSKVPTCDTWHSPVPQYSQGAQPPWTCLKDYNDGRSAAQIIYDAAQHHGINPQVILVTLQKETGLITDSWPYPWQYRTAMGMGCPDGAPCDSQYYGFANQVDQGTRLLRGVYDQRPGWYLTHWPGVNSVRYHPNGACGSSQLNLNRATAALYQYTPYQPNAAALADMYGTGDGCSSFGNRNFWRDFTNWFGSTLAVPYSWDFVSQDADRNLWNIPAGQKATLTVRARNTGTATWRNDGPYPIRISANRPNERSSEFRTSSWMSNSRAGNLQESSVAPGQVGTFVFTVQAPVQTGDYDEYFTLMIENAGWMNDPGMFFRFRVAPANLASTVTSTSGLPTTMDSNTTSGNTTVTVRNDGNTTWYNDGKYPLYLGTSNPLDRQSPFYESSTWASQSRLAKLNQASVAPGQSGTFTFKLKAPSQPGLYNEQYRVLAERMDWAPATVNAPIMSQGSYTSSTSSNPIVNVQAGESASVTLSFTNTGTSTWSKTGANPVRLGTYSPIDRTSAFCDSGWPSCNLYYQIEARPKRHLHREVPDLSRG